MRTPKLSSDPHLLPFLYVPARGVCDRSPPLPARPVVNVGRVPVVEYAAVAEREEAPAVGEVEQVVLEDGLGGVGGVGGKGEDEAGGGVEVGAGGDGAEGVQSCIAEKGGVIDQVGFETCRQEHCGSSETIPQGADLVKCLASLTRQLGASLFYSPRPVSRSVLIVKTVSISRVKSNPSRGKTSLLTSFSTLKAIAPHW